MSDQKCRPAAEVYDEELAKAIAVRRKFWRDRAQKKSSEGVEYSYPEPSKDDLVGLALSGGGIRSAMFNLGLLQAFEKTGLMKHVDYLASVSGGGYTNGYYSTLRNEKGFDDSKCNSVHTSKELSPRDTQFLLEGQYLNRPIEFLTTYLVKTSLIVIAAASFLLAISCAIAIYFRLFDYPAVRTWLGMLDVSSDLRAGLFSAAVMAVLVLLIRALYHAFMWIRSTPVPASPGQWAIIIIASFLFGIAIMIGNGDFGISSGTGILPEKLDLPSLQLPIAILVAVLFSPFLKFSSLLKSEKVNASLWQKIALFLILGGTTWGALFALVGCMGMENVSGFITNRPPTFVQHDIHDFKELAKLCESSSEFRPVLDLGTAKVVANLDRDVDELSRDASEAFQMSEDLRPERAEWYSWSEFKNFTLSRWMRTVTGRITNEGDIYDYVEAQSEVYENGPLLTDRLNKLIDPTKSPKASEINENLIALTALAIARARPELDKSNSEKSIDGVAAAIRDGTLSSTQEEEIVRIVAAWSQSGGGMLTKKAETYKDLSAFQVFIDKCRVGDKWSIDSLTNLEVWQLNRMLLEIAYPRVFKQRLMISTWVVVHEDQLFRLLVCFWATVCFVVSVLLLDMNWVTAWFHFYRKRVHETFLMHEKGKSKILMSELEPHKVGSPYPLFVAGMILPQAPPYSRNLEGGYLGDNPTKLDGSFASNWYSFLFSPLYCGWLPSRQRSIPTYRATKEYANGSVQVDEAVVLSGAAVTPFMSESFSMRLLMHVFNLRLEQWMPNPNGLQPHSRRFSLTSMAREWWIGQTWGSRKSDDGVPPWNYAVIADGGFREFLGVEELIARRCKIVIVSDAGCNNGLYEFGVLADLIRKLRLDHSIDILDLDHDRPLDTRRLKRTELLDGKSPQHFVLGRIRYPERLKSAPNDGDKVQGETAKKTQSDVPQTEPHQEALLVYVQMSLTGDEDIDIEQFRRTNPNFPDEPISNQFYSREQVESFRQLGEHIGGQLCRDISRFDCPISSSAKKDSREEVNQGEKLREWRIRKLEDAFRSTYRNECRQESVIAHDDARIGWILNVSHLENQTLRTIHQFESLTNHEHQLLIRDFVWNTLDDIATDRKPFFHRLSPADLFGISVECNRRHAGFRPEWPTSFFQVGGRDLLIKAAQRSVFTFSDGQPKSNSIDEFVSWYSGHSDPSDPPELVTAMSRLAVMLPRGVFRKNGCRTSAEVLACMVGFVFRVVLAKPEEPLDWIRSEHSQKALRAAIKSGKATEVERTLLRILSVHREPMPPSSPVHAPIS